MNGNIIQSTEANGPLSEKDSAIFTNILFGLLDRVRDSRYDTAAGTAWIREQANGADNPNGVVLSVCRFVIEADRVLG